MGFVPHEIAEEQTGWEIELLGSLLTARMQRQPLFDADGQRMRS
jgi:dimethylglycine dehydrogenase